MSSSHFYRAHRRQHTCLPPHTLGNATHDHVASPLSNPFPALESFLPQVCVYSCAASKWFDCGLGCASDRKTCTTVVSNQVTEARGDWNDE